MFYEIVPSDDVAIISEAATLTYKDLAGYVDKIKSVISGRTLAFCLCENSPGSVVSYLGYLGSKVVPLMVDKKIDRDLLKHLLEVYKPEYIAVPDEIRDEFTEFEGVAEYLSYTLMRSKTPEPVELHPDLALLLTTSGSTGSPKLVRQTYTNIQSNAESIVQYLEITSDERPVTTLPMNYTYGLSIINSHLQAKATILMTDAPMNMKTFWTFMKDNKATSFGGVPFTYEMLKKLRFFKMDLPDLRYMTQAGGKLSPELHHEFATWAAERGKKFIVMYGQTEATARMGYLPAEKSIEKFGSMGFAIPGGKFILIDVNGNEITEPETVGELVYDGPNVTYGYAEKREDLAKGDERGGRLITGDMAKRDSEGFYFIVGRKKRFLKIFGNRVNLDEIDQLIKAAFDNIECASSGVDDHMKVYITDESKCDEIRKWLSETTHLSESAFDVVYIEAIPKNEAGKVLYKDLP